MGTGLYSESQVRFELFTGALNEIQVVHNMLATVS
jgi:hypothetical protein